MSAEKHMDAYIGDIAGGLIREAAMLKAKCAYLEARVIALTKENGELKTAGATAAPDHYVHQEPVTR